MKRFLLCSAILLGAAILSRAQTLTMDQVVSLAQESTILAHMSAYSAETSRWENEEFLAARRPQLSLSLTPGYQKMSFEPGNYFYKARNYNMFNGFTELRLEQKALGIGGEFYASTGLLYTRHFNGAGPVSLFSTIPVSIGYSNDLISFNPFKWDEKIANLELQEAELEYAKTLGGIALEAVTLYVNCYSAVSRYRICESNAEVAGTLLDIGREKFNVASISKNELSALELQSLNAENSLYDAREQYENARAGLLSYLGIQDEGQPLDLSEPVVPDYRLFKSDEVMTLARNWNPEYVRNQGQTVSAEKQVQKARIQGRFLQSSIDLNVGLQSSGAGIGNIYQGQTPFVIGNVTFKIPILDGGLARSRTKAAESKFEYAVRSEQETLRDIDLQVSTALKQFNIQQDLIQRTMRALSLADESFELARELYSTGETDINTFILAQNRKDEAHNNYLNSLCNYWKSLYTLKMLCGPELQ